MKTVTATSNVDGNNVEIAGVIDIPTSKAYRSVDTYHNTPCPCCGKEIKNEVYFFKSLFGGYAYPQNGPDTETICDAWDMAVGSECRKLFPEGYVFKK